MKKYVILGHSSANERTKQNNLPNGINKLILPVACGQSLQADSLYQTIYFYNNIANKFINGGNVRGNIIRKRGQQFYNVFLNKNHKISER